MAMAQRGLASESLARVLAGRGVGLENVAAFLSPSLKQDLPDPSSLADMDVAASRLADAAERRESVAIFGDYDVDGATSSALLHGVLDGARRVGAHLYSRPHLRGLRPQSRGDRHAWSMAGRPSSSAWIAARPASTPCRGRRSAASKSSCSTITRSARRCRRRSPSSIRTGRTISPGRASSRPSA